MTTVTTLIPSNGDSDQEDDLTAFTHEVEAATDNGARPLNERECEWQTGDTDDSSLYDEIMAYMESSDITAQHLIGLTPEQLFRLFFDADVVGLMLTETNKYNTASDPVTEGDLMCFMAILLLSSFVRVPRYRMLWESKTDTKNQTVAEAMSVRRFDCIKSSIHFTSETQSASGDRFFKVTPLLTLVNRNMMAHAVFDERDYVVDESMMPYYGRHTAKQAILNKPIRMGFKAFCLNQASGYCLKANMYQGKGSIHTRYAEYGVGGGTVLALLDSLPEHVKGIVFTDNFFTSISLMKELTRRRFGLIGTIRSNRMSSAPLPKQCDKKAKRGSSQTCSQEMGGGDRISLTQVKDNGSVTVATNVRGSRESVVMQRFSKEKGEKRGVKRDVSFPALLSDYNKSMHGVDIMDQALSTYRISFDRKKYYMKVFHWILQVSVVNSLLPKALFWR